VRRRPPVQLRVLRLPERRLVFDINDFDETLPGPWEWDVKRLAASLEIAARDRGFEDRERRDIVLSGVRAYHRAMRGFAEMPALGVWYAHVDAEAIRTRYQQGLTAAQRRRLARSLAGFRTKDNLGALGRFTTVVDGRPRLVGEPPLVVPLRDLLPDDERADLEELLLGLLRHYRASLPADRNALLDEYRPVDMARKVVGVGSVGTRSWIVLLLGHDAQDPLFLQTKEAGPSVLEEFLPPAAQPNAGQRVVEGQRLMQTVGDIFLGWQQADGFDG
jgi:uncharacterized protein (DUF2252 family)